jgi:hypothetical protein
MRPRHFCYCIWANGRNPAPAFVQRPVVSLSGVVFRPESQLGSTRPNTRPRLSQLRGRYWPGTIMIRRILFTGGLTRTAGVLRTCRALPKTGGRLSYDDQPRCTGMVGSSRAAKPWRLQHRTRRGRIGVYLTLQKRRVSLTVLERMVADVLTGYLRYWTAKDVGPPKARCARIGWTGARSLGPARMVLPTGPLPRRHEQWPQQAAGCLRPHDFVVRKLSKDRSLDSSPADV